MKSGFFNTLLQENRSFRFFFLFHCQKIEIEMISTVGFQGMVTLDCLVASRFHSDGGAMFGLVPRPIWERRCPPDDHNRILQHANVFLITDASGGRGLIDTGCGLPSTFSEREIEQHGLDPDASLPAALASAGVSPGDIDWIFLTHLHWDHAGGLRDAAGAPLFPAARILVHELE